MNGEASWPARRPSVRCPGCGYDQYGLPPGRPCPECGAEFHAGVVLAEVNQWVDRTVLNLWSICAMQTVGGGCTLIGLLGLAAGEPAWMVICIAAGWYVLAATLWFAMTVLSVSWRWRRPAFLNVGSARRADLRRWLLIDAVLCGLLPAALWTWSLR